MKGVFIMNKINTKTLTAMAMLIAMEIILNRFLSINAWNLKIGFAFVPVAIAAIMYGPVFAGVVAGAGDFIGATLFPIGVFFPGFTLTSFLMGAVFGLFLYKKQDMKSIVAPVLINQMVFSLLLNSLWISILYGAPYMSLLVTRIVQCAILIPVQLIVIKAISKPVTTFRQHQPA